MTARTSRAVRCVLGAAIVLALSACGVVVRAGPLSDRPDDGRRLFLSTGGSPRPFRTLGFIQVRGYGVNVAGFTEVGDAALDRTIQGTLAQEAARMGGDGVVNIEFLDENPQTDAEKAAALANSINESVATGQAQIETKERWVTVTGEVVQFTDK